MCRAPAFGMSFRALEEIRAWQLTRRFKIEVYRLIAQPPLCNDGPLREQLRDAAASAESNISEGFGRFDPADFARFVKVARASIIECKNHLIDAVDRGHIDDDARQRSGQAADDALREISGLLDYLQSPEAKRNAERIRQRRFERRRLRGTPNHEP